MLRDPISRLLVSKSSLTETQLDTYLIDRLGTKDGLRLKQKVMLRDVGPVKKGAFLRTLRQARNNLEKSVCTVILAEYLGLLDKGTTTGLIQVGNLMSTIDRESISTTQLERISETLTKIIVSLE